MPRPDTRYALNGDVCLAYQVLGQGLWISYIQGYCSNVDLGWEARLLGSSFRP